MDADVEALGKHDFFYKCYNKLFLYTYNTLNISFCYSEIICSDLRNVTMLDNCSAIVDIGWNSYIVN